ncbi:MAG: hypothetical protein JWM78_1808 [Verrucomicrobiaceae bacterium]|nr:hypothetical protein [Verrucomicrobiaceae bacterium]
MGDLAVHHVFPNLRPLKGPAFDALCAEYAARGLEQVVSFDVPGFGRNVFYDARKELGVFIEILESGDEPFHLINTMYACNRSSSEARLCALG